MDSDDNSDDSSPLETLDRFREKWQSELQTSRDSSHSNASTTRQTFRSDNNPNDQV